VLKVKVSRKHVRNSISCVFSLLKPENGRKLPFWGSRDDKKWSILSNLANFMLENPNWPWNGLRKRGGGPNSLWGVVHPKRMSTKMTGVPLCLCRRIYKNVKFGDNWTPWNRTPPPLQNGPPSGTGFRGSIRVSSMKLAKFDKIDHFLSSRDPPKVIFRPFSGLIREKTQEIEFRTCFRLTFRFQTFFPFTFTLFTQIHFPTENKWLFRHANSILSPTNEK